MKFYGVESRSRLIAIGVLRPSDDRKRLIETGTLCRTPVRVPLKDGGEGLLPVGLYWGPSWAQPWHSADPGLRLDDVGRRVAAATIQNYDRRLGLFTCGLGPDPGEDRMGTNDAFLSDEGGLQ